MNQAYGSRAITLTQDVEEVARDLRDGRIGTLNEDDQVGTMGDDGISLVFEVGIQAIEARHIYQKYILTQKVASRSCNAGQYVTGSCDAGQYVIGRDANHFVIYRLLDVFGEVLLVERIVAHLKSREVGVTQALDVVDDGLHMIGLRSFGVEFGLTKSGDAALLPCLAL